MKSGIDSSYVGRIKVNILRVIVYIVMALTVLLIFLTPQFLNNSTAYFTPSLTTKQNNAIYWYVILCCIPFLTALFDVKKICDLITQGDSFSIMTLNYLSVIVICCYIEAVINIAAIFIFPSLLKIQFYALNLLIIGICGAVAVFTTVLKELVKSAIRLREDSELTI